MASNIITRLTDPIFLTYELIISNRKVIFPTMVGLIISLAIISHSSVLVESYRQEIFEETVFRDYNKYNGDVSFGLHDDGLVNVSEFVADYTYYDQLINQSTIRAAYTDYVTEYWWYSGVEMNIWLNKSLGFEYEWMFTVSSSSEYFYNEVGKLLAIRGAGRLPENHSEIIFVRPKPDIWQGEWDEPFQNLALNSEINLTNPGHYYQNERINKTVKIVGILEISRYSWYESQSQIDNTTNLLRTYISSWSDYYILTTPSFLPELVEDLTAPSTRYEGHVELECKIFLDHSRFDAYNINGESSKLRKFLQALEREFYVVTSDPHAYSNIIDDIQDYQMTIAGLIILLLLVSLPVLCIALYLVVYSFGLIRKQKMDQIGIIKTRGGSKYQVFTVLVGEMVISTFIAVIAGYLTSAILADIVLRSSNYLEFLGEPIPVVTTLKMFQDLIGWGIIFALALNLIRIIKMSRQKITETLSPFETKDPIWKRYYLDVIIFLIGTVTWIIFMSLLNASYTGYYDPSPVLYIVYPIISLLGIPAPFFMFFGTIMVIARSFPFLMKKISSFLWKLEGGINAFSTMNIVRHKQAANRAVLLITLALSFSILASSLIFSLDETKRLSLFYRDGADIVIQEEATLNDTLITLLKENTTHLTSVSSLYNTELTNGGYMDRRNFLFIDPTTYAETAFYDPIFKLSDSLSNLMDELMDNQTILLFEGNIKEDISKPVIGGNISFRFSNSTYAEIKSFNIGGSFKYWPTFYPERWYDFSRSYWVIGSLGMYEQLKQSNYISASSCRYLAKIDSYSNLEVTISTLTNLTALTISSPALGFKNYQTEFGRIFSLSILNSDLIVCTAIAVIGVIMFAFFTYVERGKEIGVERALGMTRLQTAQSFLVEATMILTFGIIIGFFTGVYFVTMFLQITQLGQMIPPSVVSYPFTLIAQMLLVILIIAVIGTVTPAYLASRKDISRILKVE